MSGYQPSYVPNRHSRQPLSGGGYSRNSYGSRKSSYGGRGGRKPGSQKNAFGIRKDQIGGKLRPVDWAREALMPFAKRVWMGLPAGNTPSPDQTQQWRTEKEVLVEGNDMPAPIISFHNANLPDGFIRKFQELGFTAPTPIQAQGWPMALSGRDVVGIAETGSGKTLAFILPGIIHIQGQQITQFGQMGYHGPKALVVAPTRELAIQIETETRKFAYCMGVSVAVVYGGAPRRQQEKRLRSGMQFLIATPGRLLDFLERGAFTLKTCSYCVFDEADRMLDMGFEPQIRALMSQIRPDRQMLMWSATWPKEVRSLARDFLADDRLFLKIGDENKAATTVTQIVEVFDRALKQRRIMDVLREYHGKKVIVFVGTKRMGDTLAMMLTKQGFIAAAIHGDKEQWQREQSLQDFKYGKISILVATDVASRGIDVKDLSLVLNYDFPQNCEDYIHRVGRTGRAGNTGTAITFFDPRNDAKHSRKLVALLEKNNQEVPSQLRMLTNNRSYGGSRSRFGSRFDNRNNRGPGRHHSGGHSRASSYRPY